MGEHNSGEDPSQEWNYEHKITGVDSLTQSGAVERFRVQISNAINKVGDPCQIEAKIRVTPLDESWANSRNGPQTEE